MKKRMMRGSSDANSWWRSRVAKTETPFFAKADSRLAPNALDTSMPSAKVFSMVFDMGTRHYCFDNQADRDRFLTLHRKVWSAAPVGKDPCP